MEIIKCVLFDLDGTLISTGGAGIRALEKAFETNHRVPRAARDVDPAGKTDPAIIREIFKNRLERDCSQEEMDGIQEKYLEFLGDECETARDYKVMKGIPEILKGLKEWKVLTGLGTGNLEKGAKIKLTRAGLNRYFPFGGFGSDSENRADLLKIAVQKAEKRCRGRIQPNEVYVVGDTVKDIRAAREARFKVIAVATGHTSAESLGKLAPDFLIPDFRDPGRFMRIIRDGT